MTINLNWGVVFGKGDSSDVFEWEVELNINRYIYTAFPARMRGQEE